MAVLWTTDAYQTGDLTLWDGQQEVSPDRYTCIAPPAEVGGGPQSRSFLGKSRILSGDPAIFGTGNNRCEVVKGTLTDASIFQGHSCQGGDIWGAFEVYFGNPSVVSDENAYRTPANGEWNHFIQWHQRGAGAPGGTQPLSLGVSSSGGSPTHFNCWTRGGNEVTGVLTPLRIHPLTAFSYGWHEFRWYIKFGQADGRSKVWHNGTVVLDYTGPVGFDPDTTGSICNYLKAGCYRGATLNNSTTFHGGIRWGTTEADILAGGGTEPPPDPLQIPATNTRQRRFGKATVGGSRNGFSQDNKRGSKFVTGLASTEEGDVKDMHIWIEGGDGSASTQKVTLGIYKDDGTGGLPGTKLGESDVEIELAGTATGAWRKVTHTAIRIVGTTVWLVAGSGSPSNRLRYATDGIANALVFASDAYEVSAPRLADPFGSASLDNLEMSICADYDVVGGTSPPGGDTTAPALQVLATTVDGSTVILNYDEVLDTGSVPAGGDYVVLVDGIARAVTSVVISGSTVQLSLLTSVTETNVVTISYTQVAGRDIQDISGNSAANFSGQAVVNQTSPENSPHRTLVIARTTSVTRVSNPSARIAGLGGGGI